MSGAEVLHVPPPRHDCVLPGPYDRSLPVGTRVRCGLPSCRRRWVLSAPHDPDGQDVRRWRRPYWPWWLSRKDTR